MRDRNERRTGVDRVLIRMEHDGKFIELDESVLADVQLRATGDGGADGQLLRIELVATITREAFRWCYIGSDLGVPDLDVPDWNHHPYGDQQARTTITTLIGVVNALTDRLRAKGVV